MDRRFEGDFEDLFRQFDPRDPSQIPDAEAIKVAGDIGYNLYDPDGQVDSDAMLAQKNAIARSDRTMNDPQLMALIGVLRSGQN